MNRTEDHIVRYGNHSELDDVYLYTYMYLLIRIYIYTHMYICTYTYTLLCMQIPTKSREGYWVPWVPIEGTSGS